MRETATSSQESGAGLKGLIVIPESESEVIFFSVSPVVMFSAAIVIRFGVGGVSVRTSSRSRGNHVISISPQQHQQCRCEYPSIYPPIPPTTTPPGNSPCNIAVAHLAPRRQLPRQRWRTHRSAIPGQRPTTEVTPCTSLSHFYHQNRLNSFSFPSAGRWLTPISLALANTPVPYGPRRNAHLRR